MDYETLLRQLHQGEIQEVYFFYGEEVYLQQQALLLLQQKILPQGMEEFNRDVVSAEEVSARQVAELAMNLPFLAERRLVLVREAQAMLAGKGETAGVQSLIDYLDTPNPQCCLVFCSSEAPKKTGALQKKLHQRATLVEFAPLKGKLLAQWIRSYVEAAGRRIDGQALEYLCAVNAFDLQIMKQELDKLLLFCPAQQPIAMEHVQQIVTKTVEANIFLLSDSIGLRRGREALQVLRDLFAAGETVYKLLPFLARHFRNLLAVKDYRRMGYQEGQIREQTGLHPFVIKKTMRQASQFTIEQLVAALERLLLIEVELKSTSANGEELLEQFVLELCYLEQAQ